MTKDECLMTNKKLFVIRHWEFVICSVTSVSSVVKKMVGYAYSADCLFGSTPSSATARATHAPSHLPCFLSW